MPDDLDRQQDQERSPQPHHHDCGNLFGCGEEKGTGVFREDIKDAAFTQPAADRLLHMDEMNQEQLDGYLTARELAPADCCAPAPSWARWQASGPVY